MAGSRTARIGTRYWPTRVLALVLLSTLGAVAAAEKTADWDGARLFDEDEPLAVTITGPLKTLFGKRPEEPEQMPGSVTVDGVTVPVKLRQRGNYRRRADVCRIPPIRLNFRRKEVANTAFHGQNKLKLVTHCKPTGSYEQNLLEEYLNYRLYRLISDDSFRVRLLRITWVDDQGKRPTATHWGFLIESLEELAHRRGATIPELGRISIAQLDPLSALHGSLFQFLIANTDYSFLKGPGADQCCHNAKLLAPTTGATSGLIPVPYDFDSAGSVNAKYAAPSEKLKIKSVRTRLYRGFCTDEAMLSTALQRFLDQRAELENLVKTFEPLPAKAARRLNDFVGGFYQIIDDPRQRQRKIVEECR